MPWDLNLRDPDTNVAAKVSPDGEQYVVSRAYSTPYYVLIDAVDTPFEVISAIAGKRFIVKDILIASSKSFGVVAAETVTIYEASPADLTINTKTFTRVDLVKNDRLVATGLNIASSKTVALVAIAGDTSVDVTISGYYIPVND